MHTLAARLWCVVLPYTYDDGVNATHDMVVQDQQRWFGTNTANSTQTITSRYRHHSYVRRHFMLATRRSLATRQRLSH
eukprot:m.51735 g.51735  ORF g.51735 m.51735 type:complete len:78 (-) comp7329_c0_seq1:1029-1262(-)